MRSGKAPVSCIPCAKRKVRCDKQLPCCHCKRRPQDTCTYPKPDSASGAGAEELGERVAHLERLVRNLGGDPNGTAQPNIAPTPVSVTSNKSPTQDQESQSAPTGSHAPFARVGLLANNEEATYVESPMWYSWQETNFIQGETPGTSSKQHQHSAGVSSGSGYITTILDPVAPRQDSCPDTWRDSTAHLGTIWKLFLQNVHPLIKIFFSWEVEQIIVRAQHGQTELSGPETALVSAISLLATLSVTEDDCMSLLDCNKSKLLHHLQQATEIALRRVGYAVTSNRFTMQAFMLYLHAIRSRAHPGAVFSLLGIASRIAERMGLHRDGDVLGLSVLRSEERRRMWWQLQFMEIMLATQIGTLTIGVMGKWDSKMPANIDDDELGPETTSLPPERSSLTSMSNCLWRYTVLRFHRELRNGDRILPTVGETGLMMDSIAETLRTKFVQHCELLNPLHVNLQLGICQIIIATKRLLHQPAFVNAKISNMSQFQRDELLDVGSQNLQYCNLVQTSEQLKGFRWNNNAFFPWAAFIYVILEANHRCEKAEVEDIWKTISRTYEVHEELRTADHRQDVTFAARITSSAWQRYQAHLRQLGASPKPNPDWITEVQKTFHLQQPVSGSKGPEERPATAESADLGFDLDLDMIDWSAWDAPYFDVGFFGNSG
ncbi:fungal specific transcription factor domain-containing protein [Sarocladium implicatum]|nr:fungal specific transcription factor domain-containing protein [Sarocladium implicatum]